MRSLLKKQNLSYCGELVRKGDPDRYMLSMFLPAKLREDVWALFAFNFEISKTRELVSESTLGLIRLQWWRDAIKDIYEQGKVPEHEILKPLAEAIKTYDLPRESFDKLIYAREFDLEDVLPGNIEGLLNYAEFTTQPLYELVLRVMGADPSQEVVQPIAVNYALAGILRATVVFARQGRLLFPEDLMSKHHLTKDDIFNKCQHDNIRGLVEDVVAAKLERSRPDNIFLKAVESLSEMYFKQIKSMDYDILCPDIQRAPAFKALRMLWSVKVL